jgi:IS5 family transposase
VIRAQAPQAQDWTHEKATRNHPLTAEQKAKNTPKSRVRATGEPPFLVIQRLFGFMKTRYRGLRKNAHRLFVTCALANLFMVRRRLLRLQGA